MTRACFILFFFCFTLNAAELALVDLNGKNYQPTKKITLVLFWATWCADCKEIMKERLNQFAGSDLDLITVNVDDNIERTKHFLQKKDVGFPVYRDQTKKMLTEFAIGPVPHWAIFVNIKGQRKSIGDGTGFDEIQIKKLIGQAATL